ncbi:MAG: SDR family oxidoreductase [Candidatus Woesearchaeota archaeon]
MKYIVTGGAGFIGSHIVERLVNEKKEVLVLDDLSTGKLDNIRLFLDKLTFVKGTILDLNILRSLIKEGDIIFHQAAIPSVSRSLKEPILSNKVNVEGTLNLLVVAKEKKAKRFIFASSSSIYGDSEKLPKNENMPPNPKSPYALSKYTAETYVILFNKLYGLETVSLRYFNVFGPRQDPESEYAAVIPKFIKIMINNESPIIFGDGKQTRDFTYVSNVVDANILASVSEKAIGKIINVACGERYSLIDLVNILNKKLQKNIKPVFNDERKGDVKHSLADISSAKELLGYVPKINFERGIELTIKSFMV